VRCGTTARPRHVYLPRRRPRRGRGVDRARQQAARGEEHGPRRAPPPCPCHPSARRHIINWIGQTVKNSPGRTKQTRCDMRTVTRASRPMLPLMLAQAVASAVGTQAAVAASAAASTIAAGADIVHMPHGADAVTALLSGACSRCCASAPCLWCAVRHRASGVLCAAAPPFAACCGTRCAGDLCLLPWSIRTQALSKQARSRMGALCSPPPSRRLFDRCFRWLRVGLRTDWAAGL